MRVLKKVRGKKFYLTFHRVRIDLAHVRPGVFGFDVLYQQLPHGRARTSFDGDARIVSDHVHIYRLDGLRVGLDPSDLCVCPFWLLAC